jgi:hypothetical protein
LSKKVFKNSSFGRKSQSQASRVYRSQLIKTIEKKNHKTLVSPMTKAIRRDEKLYKLRKKHLEKGHMDERLRAKPVEVLEATSVNLL